MTAQDILGILANLAAIVTAVVAVYAYSQYRLNIYWRRKKIEDYLWHIVTSPQGLNDPSDRSIEQLVTELGMSEQDIMSVVFSSPLIERILGGGTGPTASRLRVNHRDRQGRKN